MFFALLTSEELAKKNDRKQEFSVLVLHRACQKNDRKQELDKTKSFNYTLDGVSTTDPCIVMAVFRH